MRTSGFRAAAGLGLLALLTAAGSPGASLPRPDHVVIVIEENKSFSTIVGNASAPYINSLAARGAVLTDFHALVHPSQPNYLALFSGSAQGVTSDDIPPPGSPYAAPNLATGLFGAGLTFAGYSEDLPFAGFTGDGSGNYHRRHNPWVDFSNVPASSNLPLGEFPSPDRFDALPTVSIVVPNLMNDMHFGSIAAGDAWLRDHLDAYVQWAEIHNSLLIVTWDESDSHHSNHIPTLLVGPMVRVGTSAQPANHLHLLRTVEEMYGLSFAGESANVAPIGDVWVEPAPASPPPEKPSRKCGVLGIGAALLVLARRILRRR